MSQVTKYTSGMHIGLYIYLQPVRSQKVGDCLYNLATNWDHTCHQVTVILITGTVIEMVKRLSKADGMNRLALIDWKKLSDSTWIAGVDYTDDFYDDIYHDPDYEDI